MFLFFSVHASAQDVNIGAKAGFNLSNTLILLAITIPTVLYVVALIANGFFRSRMKRLIDRSLSKSHFSQVFILAFTIVFVFLLLVFFSTVFSPLKEGLFMPRFWSALSHFFNPGSFNKDGSGDIPNGWIFFINVFGMILMTGLLISVLSNLLERRVDHLKNGRVHYRFKDHFVIIGYDKMTISLIKQLAREHKRKDIIIQTVQDVPTVRHELFSYLTKEVEKQVSVLSGNRNAQEDLEKLCLPDAQVLFVLGETDEYDHDSLSVECLKKIHKILHRANVASKKPCHVLFDNQSTYAILQQQDLMAFLEEHNAEVSPATEKNTETTARKTVGNLDFLPFNFEQLWAQKVFVDNVYRYPDDESETIEYLPLDRDGIRYDSDKTVHLVIIGMSKMGVALGVQASHLSHFPNFIRDKSRKTKITFIDENADREMNFLRGRYHHLLKEIDYAYEDAHEPANRFDNRQDENTKGQTVKTTDLAWHFIKGRLEEPAIRQRLISYTKENTCLTIAICLNLPALAIASGLYLPEDIYATNVQLLVKQNTPHSILSLLKTAGKYKNVKPFGMLDNSLDLSKANHKPAKVVHYIYEYFFDETTSGQIPQSLPPEEKYEASWQNLPTAHKHSNVYHADMLPTKLRSIDNDLPPDKQIERLAEVEHNRWNTEKLLIGYRPTTRDEDHRLKSGTMNKQKLKNNFIHPDIKPYHALSEEMKNIDRMISGAIPLINQVSA
jgi:hypothetical protein